MYWPFDFDPLDYEDFGALDYWRARRLAEKNQRRHKALKRKARTLKKQARRLPKQHRRVLRKHWDGELVPFATAFGQLSGAGSVRDELLDRVPAASGLTPAKLHFSYESVSGLAEMSARASAGAAGGAVVGGGAAAVTFAAVAAAATASTGTSIATLSGAAATSATLAWLGGGSLAAGGLGIAGGTAALIGIVALPAAIAAVAVGLFYGSRELREQEKIERRLRRAKAVARDDEARLDRIARDMRHAKRTLRRLGRRMRPLTAWLASRVAEGVDYRSFSDEEKARLAVLVCLAVAMTAIMQQAPARRTKGKKTKVSKDLRRTLTEVDRLLKATPKDFGNPGEPDSDGTGNDPSRSQ